MHLTIPSVRKDTAKRDSILRSVITTETRMMRSNINKYLPTVHTAQRRESFAASIAMTSKFQNRADDSLSISILGSSINFQLSI